MEKGIPSFRRVVVPAGRTYRRLGRSGSARQFGGGAMTET
jgi:hypothetical protein